MAGWREQDNISRLDFRLLVSLLGPQRLLKGLSWIVLFFFFFPCYCFFPHLRLADILPIIRTSGEQLFSPRDGGRILFVCLFVIPRCYHRGIVACSENAAKQSIWRGGGAQKGSACLIEKHCLDLLKIQIACISASLRISHVRTYNDQGPVSS